MHKWWFVVVPQWWTGLLEHSILSTEWWESVLQGSAGSFLALAGVLLLIRHELRRDERARQIEKEKEAQKRTSDNILVFTNFCASLLVDFQKMENPLIQLRQELIKFSIREAIGRPDLGKWIRGHQNYLGNAVGHDREAEVAVAASTLLSASLSSWMIQGCPKGYFDTHFNPKDGWQALCESVEVNLTDFVSTSETPTSETRT